MLKIGKVALIILVIFAFTSVSLTSESNNYDKPDNFSGSVSEHEAWVSKTLTTMTLEEKIGQLFFIPAYSNLNEKHVKEVAKLVSRHHVGGIVFFQGGPVRQAQLTNQFQNLSKVPLMIAMDAEWGPGMRLDSVMDFPYQMTLGAVQENRLIYEMGSHVAGMLSRLGVHMNFAPVADVNTNPDNPVINHRSFGEDKANVSHKAHAYMKGMQDNKVLAVAKHFPGHGNTSSDSHHSLPMVKESMNELFGNALVPFQYLINNGIGGVMVAHLAVSAFDSSMTKPSSLLPSVVDSMLREVLGFKGLVITDALNMKGVKGKDPEAGEIEIKALKAGNDILLMSEDVAKAIKAIKKAIRKGEFPEEIIDIHVRRILEAKAWCGLTRKPKIELGHLTEDLNKVESEVLMRRLIESSLTVLRNEMELIPLKRLDTLDLVTVSIGGKSSTFAARVDDYTNTDFINVDPETLAANSAELLAKVEKFNMALVVFNDMNQRAYKRFGLSEASVALAKAIAGKVPSILIIPGNPYALNLFDSPDLFKSIVVAYDSNPLAQDAAAQLVFGGIPATGMLPVSLKNGFNESHGRMLYAADRLAYTIPESVGMRSDSLQEIDSIVAEAVEEQATPGCQILIARKGKVVFHKAYGHFTSKERKEVTLDDLYDLASITKISATLPILMKWYEEGIIDIEKALSDYLPALDTTVLKGISIKDILGHQGRLFPWIPFYKSTIEDELYDSIYRTKAENAYTVQVANGLFIRDDFADSIFFHITQAELREEKEYKYSDLGYYLFQMMIEKISGEKLESQADSLFYQPLGAFTLGYLPLERYPKENIVPTERDQEFRKQLLQGYVHDPGAAMLGGVGGHAGLFSNSNDLAKLMQMYLQQGRYGGEDYFLPSTIETFASAAFLENENRRGIGFDKPEMDYEKVGPTFKGISGKSFGHTGFTGTMAWIDPELEIVYIFLSNRICPDASNSKLIQLDIRTRIQEQIYKSVY
jgi:beta-N-acetylhexosaminidase